MADKPTTALDYNPGTTVLPEGAFRISASKFNTFMTAPHTWYREVVLDEAGFTGNTSSVIGTLVHYTAEQKALGLEPDLSEIEQYLENHSNVIEYPDIDVHVVRDSWKQMAMTLVNEYVLPNRNNLEEVEPFVYKELYPGYFPSGSIDRVEKVGDSTMRIVDYKTYNSKTKPKSIPMYYKYQLLIYAYIYSKPVSEIRLVYVNREIDDRYISEKTGKQCGKIHPPEVTVLTEQVTQDDLDFIESVLRLCCESHMLVQENPDLAYLIYRDFKLKQEK
jgi:hypothetical protein